MIADAVCPMHIRMRPIHAMWIGLALIAAVSVALVALVALTAAQGTPPAQADFDGSGTVDFADFILFAVAFGKAAGDPAYDAAFDIVPNRQIDFNDFLAFAGHFGKTTRPEDAGENLVKVIPEEAVELLANPGMGWQTFHRFADRDPNLEGLPSASVYYRLHWVDLEPVEGRIDFAEIDSLLAGARRAGQQLAFRVMCANTVWPSIYMWVPQWLKDKGCRGFDYRYQNSGSLHWVPDMDDPIFQEAHFRFLRELGKRYDGHPDLGLMDIGTVGLWGEWHMSGTGVDLPSHETRQAIIDVYREAFPNTPKVMLIADENGMRHATHNGCGWRADCLGDMGGFSPTWNHMTHFYPQQIQRTDAGEAWKVAPVAFETCWDMRKWAQEGWDIRGIFDFALSSHASYINNKSAPIPEGARHEVERLLRKLGYRLVLREMAHSNTATLGSLLSVSMIWENVGVTPPYGDYLLALRVTGEGDKGQIVFVTDISVKGWLPGKTETAAQLELPEDLKPGQYELALAIVDPVTHRPAIRLAIAGRAEDGWHPLSRIEVTGQ